MEQKFDLEAEPEPETEQSSPSPKPPPKLGWIKPSAAFIADFKQPDYLIYGLLLRAFVYSFTGMTGAGKTSLCLRLAAHVARGLPIGKLEVERGKVLYFAGENADDVRMRWIKLCEELNVNPNDIDVCFIDFRMQLSLDTVKLRLGNKSVDHGPFALVIVDTSIAYFEGDNENDNVQAAAHAKVMRGLIDVIEGRPTVIVTAHPINMQPWTICYRAVAALFSTRWTATWCARRTTRTTLSICTGKANSVARIFRRSRSS